MTNVTLKCGCCFIVPLSVLRQLAQAEQIETADRDRYQRSYATTQQLRLVREGHRQASLAGHQSGLDLRATAVAKVPVEHLFDCKHNTTLPGTPVPTPTDTAFTTVFDTTAKVAEFYKTVLGRNSVDNQGMDLVSSLNYDRDYQNAFWDGQQMVYGNGDNKIFIDFWRSPDVIGHELTHGVTQHESGLIYEGQSGALNESISDCFGAAFAQWLAKKPASDAGGWLIGAGIMGPEAKAKGFTCLRDMVNPGAKHCLSPQPDSFKDFDPTADVHDNSGIPNRAFAVFAQNLGGNTYDLAIKVWYDACVSGLSSRATFADFAHAAVAAAKKKGPAVAKAVTDAWQAVDLSINSTDAASSPERCATASKDAEDWPAVGEREDHELTGFRAERTLGKASAAADRGGGHRAVPLQVTVEDEKGTNLIEVLDHLMPQALAAKIDLYCPFRASVAPDVA